jgi:hypothetical protein
MTRNRFFATAAERSDEYRQMTLRQQGECRAHVYMTVSMAVRGAA